MFNLMRLEDISYPFYATKVLDPLTLQDISLMDKVSDRDISWNKKYWEGIIYMRSDVADIGQNFISCAWSIS